MRSKAHFAVVVALFGLATDSAPAAAARLKDIADVEGFRTNPLTGLGIVVGLAGTGDDFFSSFAWKPLAQAMKHLGVTIDPTQIRARNVAAVMVTANLPPFARPGMPVDVTVASIGSARSLQGGTLILTPMRGANQEVYALAQGPLTVGGFSVEGLGGSTRKNHTNVARIPSGGIVEREAPGGLPKEEIVLVLREPDFTTASRVAAAINRSLGAGAAQVRDPATVSVAVAGEWKGRVVDLVAALEAIDATPDVPARVVIDERTGTIVVGATVTLGAAAVAHGGITVNVAEHKEVSQPIGFAPPQAQTVVVPETEIAVDEKEGQMKPIPESATVGDVAAALNALGVKPRDLVSILQALKAAGALHAEIQVL